MKTIFFFILASLTILSFDFKSGKPFVPPGTVRVNDTLYFDETETSNLDWREYMWWHKQQYGDSSAEYKNAIPDTLVWRDELTYNEPYVAHYYRHPAYSNFPVVGISYEQAVNYCQWRTERVKQLIELNKQYGKKIMPKAFYYLLPSKSEWEAIAKVGYSEDVLNTIRKRNYKLNELRNVMSDSVITNATNVQTVKYNSSAEITAPVETYFPNSLGIYNLFGNVAEMIAEKGISKGGSWKDRNRTVILENDFPYEKPTSWLGFRCVCQVHCN